MSTPALNGRPSARFLAIAAGCMLVAALVGGAFCAWQRQAAARSITLAETRFLAGDLRGAYLAAHQAHSLGPDSLEPLRLLVRITARAASPEELLWRQRLCEAAPVTPPEEWIALAECAVKLEVPAIAGDALDRVPEGPSRTAHWYRIAAATAASENQVPLAVSILAHGASLYPDDPALLLNLAAAHIARGTPEEAASAKDTLSRFESDPEHSLTAQRNLLALASRNGDHAEALRIARTLRDAPNAAWRDRFQVAELLRDVSPDQFEEELSAILSSSGSHSDAAYTVMAWMNSQGLAERSAAWAESLGRSVSLQPPAVMAWAEALLALERWHDLDRVLAGQPWGALEPLRRSFRARAAARNFDRENYPRSADEWSAAIQAARDDRAMLAILARQAEAWGWKREATQAWHTIAWMPNPPASALKNLYRITKENGSTEDLYGVVRHIASLQPGNPIAQNNLAALGILLGKEPDTAAATAADLHRRFPQIGPFACTHALALLASGAWEEARAILENLDPDTLKHPSAKLYLAIARTATGDANAKTALGDAMADPGLFPEERALARRALAGALPGAGAVTQP